MESAKERALMWGVSRMERVMIVFGRGVGEVIRALWSWWRTALRSYGDVRIGWKGGRGASYEAHVSIWSVFCSYNVHLKDYSQQSAPIFRR